MHEVELHAEVAEWLDKLNPTHFDRVEALAGRLAENPRNSGVDVRMLDGEVWELRFRLSGDAWRLTYWVRERTIIFLTVIRKTQNRQPADLTRAYKEQRACAEQHGSADTAYER